MKTGFAGKYLHLVCTEPGEKVEMACDVPAMDQADGVSMGEKQNGGEHGVHSVQWWSNEREARIRMLRAHVQAGTYRVDSVALAESILDSTSSHDDVQKVEKR